MEIHHVRSHRSNLDPSHAFAVIAHGDPQMFHRLTQKLLEIGPVFAHLDAKTNSHGWADANPEVIFLDKRVKVYWGHWSMVEATMRLMERALTDPAVNRITLVSGAHYLLWSPAEIAARSVSAIDVIAAREAPNMPDGSRPEVEYGRRFVASRFPDSLGHRLANAFINRVVRVGRPLKWRDLVGPEGMRAGSQWWSLTRRTAELLVRRVRVDDELVRYFKKVNCPDEKVFATLFAELDQTPHVSGTTFAKWRDGPNPVRMELGDLEVAREDPGFWFARKFSSSADAVLLDWLDNKMQK